ncbi:hypothetical protein TNCV_1453001 [Trichonephila clavipes]|nr:hypothetical protein TNCV_1453001 [Trichonephila clavipes]
MKSGQTAPSTEKAKIGLQDLIPISHSSHSVSFNDMEVCAAIQRHTCPDHQASSAVIFDFSNIGGQVAGLPSPLDKKSTASHHGTINVIDHTCYPFMPFCYITRQRGYENLGLM